MGCGSSFSILSSINHSNEKTNSIKTNSNMKQRRQTNIEPFTLVCFDEHFNENDKQFQQLIDFICCFDDLKQCEEYILNSQLKTLMFLIISKKSLPNLISHIHDLSSLLLIYIFDDNQTNHIDKHWTKRYSKIKGIYSDRESLYDDLSSDINKYLNLCDLIPISVYSRLDALQMNLNCSDHHRFLFYQLFFYQYSLNSTSKLNFDEFLKLTEEYYSKNRTELKLIKKFEDEYHPSKDDLVWLIKNTFIRRISTKSLLNLNIRYLIALQFVFKDFHNLMSENLSSSKTFSQTSSNRFSNGRLTTNEQIVYRGQILEKNTFLRIKSNIGEILSMNNFLLASENRQKTLEYLTENLSSNENFYRVLFEMKIPLDYSSQKQRPFVYLKNLLPEEENFYSILFYIGSIFRINTVGFDLNNDCWIIKLSLYDEKTNEDFSQIFSFIKNFQMSKKENLLNLAAILRQIYPNAGEIFYEYLLNDNSQMVDKVECYRGLGLCFYLQEKYDDALNYLNKALKLNRNDKMNQSSLHNHIGLIYAKQNQIEQAFEHFSKALDYSSIPIHISCLHYNLALIYSQQGLFQQEIQHYQKALEIRANQYPNEHLQMANLYNNIGIAYSDINDYDRALENLKKALQIRLKCLPETHIDIARNYVNIGTVYTKTQEFRMALDYFNKAQILFEQQQNLPENDLQQLKNNIRIVNDKMRRKTY